jgi:putative glutathione S-transferase
MQDVISLSIVNPVISDQGWTFSERWGSIPDSLYGADYLWQIYTRAKADYSGRVTVPVLWDKQTQTIVNNESRQIIQMLNLEFNEFAAFPDRDFYPEALRPAIAAAMDTIYQPINNGINRSGFRRGLLPLILRFIWLNYLTVEYW